jgi:hypothetical protein
MGTLPGNAWALSTPVDQRRKVPQKRHRRRLSYIEIERKQDDEFDGLGKGEKVR